MKKLFLLAVVTLVLGAVGRCLPHYSVYKLAQALDRGELDTVMKYADVNKFAELPVDLTVEMASAGMKDAAGLLGEALGKLFGVPIGAVAKQVGGPLATAELRRRIENRELRGLLGGFEPKSGFGWYGGIEIKDGSSAVLTVDGTCPSRERANERVEVHVGIDFVRVPGVPFDWRAMGVDPISVRSIIRDCTLAF